MLRKVVAVFLTLAILAIVLCLYLISKQDRLPVSLPPLTPANISQAQSHIDSALSPVIQPAIKKPSRKGTFAQVASTLATKGKIGVVSLSETDVDILLEGSKQVCDDLAAQGVTNAQVAFRPPNEVEATGEYCKGGTYQPVTLDGSLIADGNGSVEFIPGEIHLGSLWIPESSVDKFVRHESARLIDHALPHLPVVVDSVSVKDHNLLLSGPAR